MLYRDTLRRSQVGTFVDSEGQNVWLTEYFRFYLNGCSHEEATSRTLAEISSGSTLPTCGAENLSFPPRNLPNDFQNRLQAAYRDVLRRTETLSYVDSEGANVWLAQYLRFRVSGRCDHATAESKVFAEIRGGGVQPDCTPLPPFQGTWSGTYRISTCSASGTLQLLNLCSVYLAGGLAPITMSLRQTANTVDGTVAQGNVRGSVSGGTAAGTRLTGLTGRLTATPVALNINSWNTTVTGDAMAGDIIETYTQTGTTGSMVLGLQLQGVTRVSASVTTDSNVNQVVPSHTSGTSVDQLREGISLLEARKPRRD